MQEKLTDSESRSQASNLGDFLGAAMGTSSAAKVVNFPPRQPGRAEMASVVAVAFLKAFDPGGWHNLVALDPEHKGKPAGRTFPPGAWQEMAAWIDRFAGDRNVYFSVNEPRAGAPHEKLARADIARIRAVFVDLDLKDRRADDFAPERERCRQIVNGQLSGPVPPSFVTDSGSGFHLLWRLSDPIGEAENRERAEATCRAVAAEIDGDVTVHDTARILRLPGAANLPDARKRALGRVVRPTAVIRGDGPAYSLDVIARHFPATPTVMPVDHGSAIAEAARDLDMNTVVAAATYSKLPPDLRTRFERAGHDDVTLKELWVTGEVPKLKDGKAPDRSGSGRRFALARLLHEAGGFDVNDFGALLWTWSHAVNPGEDHDDKITEREITRAWGNAEPAPRPALDPNDWFDVLGDPPTATPGVELAEDDPDIVRGVVDASRIETRKWLMQPRLPLGDVTQIVGAPGVSKSTFMLRDALIVATGREDILRGRNAAGGPISPERLHRSGAAIVYNAEDRTDEMRRRFAAAQRFHGVSDADMRHPVRLWSGVDREQLHIVQRTKPDAPLTVAPGLARLEAYIRQLDAVLVVLDPQIGLAKGGHENSNDDGDVVMQELARLASRCGCAIAVVHHTSKDRQGAKGDMAAGRGAFAAVGKVRSAVTIVNVTGEADEKNWNVPQDGSLFRMDFAKSSHDRKPTAPIVFRRVSAPVGNGHGARLEAAAKLLDDADDPAAALAASGDFAPVLELVDIHSLTDAREPADVKEALAIAEIIDELLGDINEIAQKDLIGAAGERMLQRGITRATGRTVVDGKLGAALGGRGVALERKGQSVLIRRTKRGAGATAPWMIVRESVSAVAAPVDPTDLSGAFRTLSGE